MLKCREVMHVWWLREALLVVLLMDLVKKAKLYFDEALHLEALAMNEDDKPKRRMLLSVAEHYYLLGDKLVEFTELFPLETVTRSNQLEALRSSALG